MTLPLSFSPAGEALLMTEELRVPDNNCAQESICSGFANLEERARTFWNNNVHQYDGDLAVRCCRQLVSIGLSEAASGERWA